LTKSNQGQMLKIIPKVVFLEFLKIYGRKNS